MKKKIYVFTIFAMATLLSYCTKDFIEPNISKLWVYIVSPANYTTSSSPTPTFWWNKVTGARTYNLQIVSPSFATSNLFLLDTVIVGNKFVFSLLPGKTYEWRICAQNTVSSTQYTTYTLSIDSSGNLNSQTVILTQPTSNPFNTNASTETFKWTPLLSATEYRIVIINQSNSSTLKDTTQALPTYTIALADGAYTFQVRGQNASSNTPYTAITVKVNRAAPAASNPTYPANGAKITGADTLMWTRAVTTIADSVYISADSVFTQPLAIAPIYTTNSKYIFTAGQVGISYFWKLKSGDIQGNWSGFSSLRKFIQH